MYVITSYLHVVRSCSGLLAIRYSLSKPQIFVVISSSNYTRLKVVLGKDSINEIESLGYE